MSSNDRFQGTFLLQGSISFLQNARIYIDQPNNNYYRSYDPQESQSSLQNPRTPIEQPNNNFQRIYHPQESHTSLQNLRTYREPSAGEHPTPVIEKPIKRKPVPPPNGGLTAWLQVLGAFFLFFDSWGIINAFGAYQAFYLNDFLSSRSPSEVSWIGTTQGFLMILVGVVSGPLYDMGHLHTLIYTGAFLSFFGLIVASFADQFALVFLSLGVCVGLGSGCFFVPSISIVSTYFSTKRAAATGLTAAGGSLGGVLFPIIFRRTQAVVGYGWATRIIAFVLLGTLAIPAVVLKPRMLPSKKRTLLDLSAFKDIPYVLFSFALFFIFIGLYIPFFYIPLYAREHLGTTKDFSFYLLAILNAASIFGRIIPNIVADHIGAMHVLIPFTLATGMLAIAWIGIRSIAGVIAFCILYGFFSGAIVSLPPSALVLLSPDLSVVGTRMGMCFSLAGFGLLIGSPIAGTILRSDFGFIGLEAFSGAATVAGFVFISLAFFVHRRSQGRNRK